MTKWLDIIKYFSAVKRVHVTFFEDIAMNPVGEVRTMIEFLGIRVENLGDRLQCIKSSMTGDFKRPTRKLDFDPFTGSMKENINLFVKKAREILEKKRLPRLPYYERA